MKVPSTKQHADGTLWAKGFLNDGQLDGYWEWFRKDGTLMRSGNFDKGKQVGEWVTYDKRGEPYKTTSLNKKKID